MIRILQVTLRKGNASRSLHFSMLAIQEAMARSLVTIFAHNAGLQQTCEVLPEGTQMDPWLLRDISVTKVQECIEECSKMLREDDPVSVETEGR